MNNKKLLTLFIQVFYVGSVVTVWTLNPIPIELVISTITPLFILCWICRSLLTLIDRL